MQLSSSKTTGMPQYLKLLVLSILSLLLCINVKAQQVKSGDDQIYTAVESAAEFPGGIAKFSKYLADNIKYPPAAVQNKVEGKVFLTFVVEKDGSLTDIHVMRGIGSGADEEAVRVIKASPKWIPGKQGGKAVRQQYTVPVRFTLPEHEIYTAVDHSAEFPGGLNAFYQFLSKNIKYPAAARAKNVQGKVFLTFVVEKDGSLSDLRVMREPGSGLGDEAVRVMQSSPKWKPGTNKGTIVRQQYTVPVNFSLANK